ncbi:uncharacterized protein BT62DRAFT_1001519 [Guyanagaster necrorhizus]|uniref:Peptide N-acetyl-beta-D-glucosaminyl asparaginase amidase A N-terminal domain-containing protein n=1 Tax=Guyanagaster necrorhizus TaxID=856835 RepID=A0A9P7W1Z7_9AGAR|nr:uncharacterized protein BT62DRAFT_1001519 [Guyanagaster necrorhizus MCA 3950]KAG7450728.1 hypothetical protein BT62DRAFT_1001519 [Guyanagaster necrorhizus MCA 3950]
MTDDSTVTPLVDLQVFAPPVVPQGGQSCQVELLTHSFGDGSYNNAVVTYSSPTNSECGNIGQWAAISLNISVSSAEPTETGTIWNTIKDVTHFTPLFAEDGDFMMDFGNIISKELLLDGVLNVIITATFYAPTPDFPTPRTSDFIIPLSNLSPMLANYFTLDTDTGGTTLVSLPGNTVEAYVKIFCSGNSAEKFWYLSAFDGGFPLLWNDRPPISDTPDKFTQYFPDSTGLIGKGPFRELYATIYTGGITPSNWRLLTSYGAYNAPSYWIDTTPVLPVLLDGEGHNTPRSIKVYEVPDLDIQTLGGASEENETVWTRVIVHRDLDIQSEIYTSEGTKTVTFTQSLNYINDRLDPSGYGSEVNQTHIRAIQFPTGPYKSIHSVQHAKGWVGMDDCPGPRHAINGTGKTEQTFAYVDRRGATYFRDIVAKNDGWVHDRVGGTLRAANRPVPDNQIYGPDGGPGFRRRHVPRDRLV